VPPAGHVRRRFGGENEFSLILISRLALPFSNSQGASRRLFLLEAAKVVSRRSDVPEYTYTGLRACLIDASALYEMNLEMNFPERTCRKNGRPTHWQSGLLYIA
jgi:hypothetical protein